MTPGMLREPVQVQRQVRASLGGGASQISYETYRSTKGYMKALSGTERMYAERTDATTRNRLVMRYHAELRDSDRVVIRDRAYQIRFINNLEFRNLWHEVDLDGGVAT